MIIQDFFFLADYGTTTRTFFIVLFICMQNLSEIILFIVSYICNRFIYMQQEQQHNNCFIQYCVTLHYIWSYIGLENIYIQATGFCNFFFQFIVIFFYMNDSYLTKKIWLIHVVVFCSFLFFWNCFMYIWLIHNKGNFFTRFWRFQTH
jgi:hypothetical protein